ncbi:MAG: hypothetical protein ACI8Q2_000134 [Candidatus Omnitrophota bacterium]|jgi:hypothetical protein
MSDKKIKKKGLLRDKKVVEEINRHLWIESEKAGYDIGFDEAAVDWLENFSKAWMNYYTPKKKVSTKKTASTHKKSAKKATKTSRKSSK